MMKKRISLREIMNNQSGFTLIELIIVITVLGVIVAAFLPRTGGNVEKTKQVMHENLLNTVTSAIAEYGTEHKLTASNGTSKKIAKTATTVTTGTDITDTLLRPIDKDHPLVTGGYLDKVPLNPWVSETEFKDYKYIIDFKVTTKTVSNPDGSTGEFAKVIPVVKLAKITEASGTKTVDRESFIVIYNGVTKKAEKPASPNPDLFGYDFEKDEEITK